MEFTDNTETDSPEIKVETPAPKQVSKKGILIIIGVFTGLAIIMLAMKKSKKAIPATGGAPKKDQPYQIIVNNHGSQQSQKPQKTKKPKADLNDAIVDDDTTTDETETETDEA